MYLSYEGKGVKRAKPWSKLSSYFHQKAPYSEHGSSNLTGDFIYIYIYIYIYHDFILVYNPWTRAEPFDCKGKILLFQSSKFQPLTFNIF